MKHKKHLDFELNLIPFIDLLSTCICFLLITAVWMQIGSLNVKQAVGGQPTAETEKKPTAWITMGKNGSLTFDVKDSLDSRKLASQKNESQKTTVAAIGGKIDLDAASKLALQLRQVDPGLRTALIQPMAETTYEDMVGLMDTVKKAGLSDLGVVPL